MPRNKAVPNLSLDKIFEETNKKRNKKYIKINPGISLYKLRMCSLLDVIKHKNQTRSVHQKAYSRISITNEMVNRALN